MVNVTSFKLTSKQNWAFSCLEFGLPQGALVEVSGPSGGGKTEVVLKFLSENPQLKVAWVERDLTVYPCAFLKRKIELSRVLFVETSRYLWAAQQILKSQIFGVIVLSADVETEIEKRRLQIAAEKSAATVILISKQTTVQGSWPISVQLHVRRSWSSGEIVLEVVKYRGARQWESPMLKVNGI